VLLLVPESRGRYGAVVILLGLVQLAVLALPRLVGPILRRRTSREDLFLGASTALRLEVRYLVPRVMNAAGFVLVAAAVVDIGGVDDVLAFGAVYVLAGILGILAFLVPSGLGVREAVITALLSPRIGTADALTIAASARLYATLSDVVLLFAYLTYGRRYQTNTRRSAPATADAAEQN